MARQEKLTEAITVWLPDSDHEAFAELAVLRGKKPGVLAREVLRDFVKSERDKYHALASIFGQAD